MTIPPNARLGVLGQPVASGERAGGDHADPERAALDHCSTVAEMLGVLERELGPWLNRPAFQRLERDLAAGTVRPGPAAMRAHLLAKGAITRRRKAAAPPFFHGNPMPARFNGGARGKGKHQRAQQEKNPDLCHVPGGSGVLVGEG